VKWKGHPSLHNTNTLTDYRPLFFEGLHLFTNYKNLSMQSFPFFSKKIIHPHIVTHFHKEKLSKNIHHLRWWMFLLLAFGIGSIGAICALCTLSIAAMAPARSEKYCAGGNGAMAMPVMRQVDQHGLIKATEGQKTEPEENRKKVVVQPGSLAQFWRDHGQKIIDITILTFLVSNSILLFWIAVEHGEQIDRLDKTITLVEATKLDKEDCQALINQLAAVGKKSSRGFWKMLFGIQ
jgi:hypothetical protein